jgi:asparagine synthase (glutamine-hydrolysing)
VEAFTSVPREGFAAPDPPWYMSDEGPLAAAVAAKYANIDHVMVRPTSRLLTDGLDRDHYLYDRPLTDLFNLDWHQEINRRARERGLNIMLWGANGNLSLTYNGLEALPELIARRRFDVWMRQARLMVRAGTMRWRGALFYSLGPWTPGPLWNWLNRVRGGYVEDVARWSALNPSLLPGLKRNQRMMAFGEDPFLRPSPDSFSWRVASMSGRDGNYEKGALGGWGIDLRDPTADLRLVEFCLNVPTEQFIFDGVPRSLARLALADRLPADVLRETRRGHQAADWQEAAVKGKRELADQIADLDDHALAAKTLDLPRLKQLVADWPTDGWDRYEVFEPYRFALLAGLSVGHFLRKASGSNR